jgi:hypothetical protein
MKPKVVAKDKREFIAFVLPTAIQEILRAGLAPPSEKNFRDLISSAGGTPNTSQHF